MSIKTFRQNKDEEIFLSKNKGKSEMKPETKMIYMAVEHVSRLQSALHDMGEEADQRNDDKSKMLVMESIYNAIRAVRILERILGDVKKIQENQDDEWDTENEM